ncbi:MAG TPA: quinone oxidoreductase [Bryobacteraceae bacterium]|nr:quinone oxidoreductase [Bryobacteraceae bacterium]
MKAVWIGQAGGPEVLQFGERPIPQPAAGEALVRVAVAGVNYTDISQRSGSNKIPLPAVLGSEGAGTIEQVAGVDNFRAGDRVAWAMVRGSYAEYAAVPVKMLVKIPDGTDFRTAAAAMLQGMTAHYLSHSTFPLKQGHTALIHAAAGGTGRLLVQMAAMAGARVIATAGTDSKLALAREAGAAEGVLYSREDWVEEVKRLSGGEGVDVVYDSVGQATFTKGLDCLKMRGMMVHFGQSSGPVPPFDTRVLSAKGSLFLARPTLASHIAKPEELAWRSSDVFRWIAGGTIKLRVDREYAFAEAAEAHKDLESRRTAGKLLLRI